MKQETLEEVAENIADKCKLDAYEVSPFINGFLEGAKWQEQRMYSEEIEMLWLKYRAYTNNEDAWSFKKWLLEQLKK